MKEVIHTEPHLIETETDPIDDRYKIVYRNGVRIGRVSINNNGLSNEGYPLPLE